VVPSHFDLAEHSARVAAGPLEETVSACRKAALATGQVDGGAVVARQIRTLIEEHFAG
jgi:hypothetical protein